jgi:hypothetical protein
MFGKSDGPFCAKEQPNSVQSWREDTLHLSRELSEVTLESPLPAAVDGLVVWRGVALCYRIGMACLVSVDPQDR